MNLHSGWQREIGLILFVVSIFGILALTLWPTYIWEDSPGIWGDIRMYFEIACKVSRNDFAALSSWAHC